MVIYWIILIIKEDGDNLKKFRIYISYISLLNEKEWKLFLEEFDKLYKETFKNIDPCQHKYKNNKVCGMFSCNKNHNKNI